MGFDFELEDRSSKGSNFLTVLIRMGPYGVTTVLSYTIRKFASALIGV